MSNHEAGPAEMLPGLRASVADAKAKAAATRARKAAEFEPAELDPVARVLVDVPLAHLDRPFDYAVSVKDAATAVPGARVKVRFAGQDVDGFVLERAATSDHNGRLQPLRRVVSAEPVLHPEVAALTASIARAVCRSARRRHAAGRAATPRGNGEGAVATGAGDRCEGRPRRVGARRPRSDVPEPPRRRGSTACRLECRPGRRLADDAGPRRRRHPGQWSGFADLRARPA